MRTSKNTSIKVGCYEVVHNNGVNLRALRNGEQWRDLTGDNLVLALVDEIDYLRDRLLKRNITWDGSRK